MEYNGLILNKATKGGLMPRKTKVNDERVADNKLYWVPLRTRIPEIMKIQLKAEAAYLQLTLEEWVMRILSGRTPTYDMQLRAKQLEREAKRSMDTIGKSGR